MKKLKSVLLSIMLFSLTACMGTEMQAIKPVAQVDLPKFMGRWYVIAAIPTFIEKQAYNAVEHYELNPDGTIATTFTYHKGGFDGPLKTYNPTGYVKPGTGHALWGMQFIWPIKADYRIGFLDGDYQRTVIARNARDYVWIMARQPQISNDEYQEMVEYIESVGYDSGLLRRVPQRWE